LFAGLPKDRHRDYIVLVVAMQVKSEDLLYDNPMPVCLIFIIPSFEFNARAARCTAIAEEKEHLVF
jgi:hypothetical protein